MQFWEWLLISDSKIFTLDGGYNPQNQNQRQYLRKEDKRPDYTNTTFQRQKKAKVFIINYYGGMSHLGLTDIIKVTGTVTVTAKKYIGCNLAKINF